ncbi:MAG: hypothetical protein IJP09_01810 [Clostridia bacterium]|nr:hypothetical protein [Clostridia bacterium]
MKKLVCIVLCLLSLFSISACSFLNYALLDKSDFEIIYVKGLLDTHCHGEGDSNFLTLTDSDIEDIRDAYAYTLETEAEFMAYYWGILNDSAGEVYEDLSEKLKAELVELAGKLYPLTKYEVTTSVKNDDGSYDVYVSYEPLNIMVQAEEKYAEYEPLQDFYEKYLDADVNSMSDEEYTAYTDEYGMIVIDLIESLLSEDCYNNPKVGVIKVRDIDGVYEAEDFWDVANEFIYYIGYSD